MGCVGRRRLFHWYLALVSIAGILGKADAECDQTCQTNCRKQLEVCDAPMSVIKDIKSYCHAVSIDACSMYTKARQCYAGMPPICLNSSIVKDEAEATEEALATACGKSNLCEKELIKCPCKITGTGPQEMFAVERFCTQLTPFSQCKDGVAADCSSLIPAMTRNAFSKAQLVVNQYLYCPSVGGCDSAVTCLHQAAIPPSRLDKGYPGLPTIPKLGDLIGFDNVCRPSTVFDCLKTNTSTCKLDQGGTSMDQVKAAVTEQCRVWRDTLAAAKKTCLMFNNCVDAYLPPFLKNDNLTDEQLRTRGHHIASAFRSGFWCGWIKHSYQCMLNHTAACELNGTQLVTNVEKNLKALQTTCQGAAAAPVPPTEFIEQKPAAEEQKPATKEQKPATKEQKPAAEGATSIQPTVSLLVSSLLISITLFLAVVL